MSADVRRKLQELRERTDRFLAGRSDPRWDLTVLTDRELQRFHWLLHRLQHHGTTREEEAGEVDEHEHPPPEEDLSPANRRFYLQKWEESGGEMDPMFLPPGLRRELGIPRGPLFPGEGEELERLTSLCRRGSTRWLLRKQKRAGGSP